MSNNIFNICIVAHVDHGKTTLCDYLLNLNNLVSDYQLSIQRDHAHNINDDIKTTKGIRALDFRHDEHDRQITIGSSVATIRLNDLIINLVDSPGHFDFSAEVLVARSLSDYCILVVDVLEGICAQTLHILNGVWKEYEEVIISTLEKTGEKHLKKPPKLLLCLNKIDKIFLDQFTTVDIPQIISDLNVHLECLWNEFLIENEDNFEYLKIHRKCPISFTSGNTLFISALCGWGFQLDDFANGQFSQVWIEDRVKFSKFLKILENMDEKYGTKKFHENIFKKYPLGTEFVKFLKSNSQKIRGFEKDDIVDDKISNDDLHTMIWLSKYFLADIQLGVVLGDVHTNKTLNSSGIIDHYSILGLCRVQSGQILIGNVINGYEITGIWEILGGSLVKVESAIENMVVAISLNISDIDDILPPMSTYHIGENESSYPTETTTTTSYTKLVSVYFSTNSINDRLELILKIIKLSDFLFSFEKTIDSRFQIYAIGTEHLSRIIRDCKMFVPDLIVSDRVNMCRETLLINSSTNHKNIDDFKDKYLPVLSKLPNFLKDVYMSPSDFLGVYQSEDGGNISVDVDFTIFNYDEDGMILNVMDDDEIQSRISRDFLIFFSHGEKYSKNSFYIVSDDECDNLYKIKQIFTMAMSKSLLTFEKVFGLCFKIEINGIFDIPSSFFKRAFSYAPLRAHCDSYISSMNKNLKMENSLKIMEPIIQLSIIVSLDSVGQVINFLKRRRCKIISSDLCLNYTEYEVLSNCPVSTTVNSIDFHDSLWRECRGMSSLSIESATFKGWRIMLNEEAVFFDSQLNLEDCEDFGEVTDNSFNRAKELIMNIRRSKGLSLGEELVIDPEKQRTMTKMK